MKNLKIIFFLTLTILIFGACSKDECGSNSQKAVFTNALPSGCGWVIELNADNSKLEPTNLSDFEINIEEGKEIWVSYHEVAGGSICQVGSIVEIDCIKER